MAAPRVRVSCSSLRYVGLPQWLQMDVQTPVPRFRMEVHLLLVPWIVVHRRIADSAFGQSMPRELCAMVLTYLLDTQAIEHVAEVHARDSWVYHPDYPGAFWIVDPPAMMTPPFGEWWVVE